MDKDNQELKHDDLNVSEVKSKIFSDAKVLGSLKDSFLEHSESYGITNIDMLFPDYKKAAGKPEFINNRVEWVKKVLDGVHKLPFARVKSLFADITSESIRAKGYIKGSIKLEDVFGLLSRTTEPTTVYKKQKLDRDDILDITDFDVVAWIKEEMRLKLDEEVARAILIGDGRPSYDPYRIDPECIRPILSDEDFYTIKYDIGAAPANKYTAFADACVRARKQYKGSGSPTLFTTEDVVTELLLLKDTTGRKLYNNLEDLKSALRVSDIQTVSYMEGLERNVATDSSKHHVIGIIVNLDDYSVGSNKGGEVSMFDDFDIDFNQLKYLLEARCSGALTTPYSAIVIEQVVPAKA